MYFELTAPDQRAFKHAFWDADLLGLDPSIISERTLTFGIGTGSIEKVSSIRDKFNLKETYTSDAEPSGYIRR
jgi:hypothetical protein